MCVAAICIELINSQCNFCNTATLNACFSVDQYVPCDASGVVNTNAISTCPPGLICNTNFASPCSSATMPSCNTAHVLTPTTTTT